MFGTVTVTVTGGFGSPGSGDITGPEYESNIVFATSPSSNVKLLSFVITVFIFAILGSTSNCSSTEFQSIPFPARSGYPPVAPPIALVIAVLTNDCVAKFAVFDIPWTSVVSELCAEIAAFLFTISAASATTRF